MKEMAAIVSAHALVPAESGRPLLLPLPRLEVEHSGTVVVRLLPESGAVQLRAMRALDAGAELTVEAASI